jgi:hypothetical protein
MMHAANTVTHIMASDDESFNQEMKWRHAAACHAASKQEAWNSTVGQQGYGILWISYWLILGLKWEP